MVGYKSIKAVGGADVIRRYIIDREDYRTGKENVTEILDHFGLHKRHRNQVLGYITDITRALKKCNIIELIRNIPRRPRGRPVVIRDEDKMNFMGLLDYYSLMETVSEARYGCLVKVVKLKEPNKDKVFIAKLLREDEAEGFQIGRELALIFRNDSAYLSLMVDSFHFSGSSIPGGNVPYFMVYDFNVGGDLRDLIIRGSVFNFPVIFAELLVALKKLHKIGVIHGDIKLENVMVDGDGHVTLIDFDISFYKSTRTHYLDFGCKPYFAPEMIEGLEVIKGFECSQDYWALGVLFYELSTGQTLFPMSSNLYDKIMNKTIPNLEPISSPENSFLHGLLERNVEKRMEFVSNIETHPIFNGIDWDQIKNKTHQPPFRH